MTTEMPKEIWACVQSDGFNHWVDDYPLWGGSTHYTRTDTIPDHTELLRRVIDALEAKDIENLYFDLIMDIGAALKGTHDKE